MQQAVQGGKRALRAVCERFKIPILAVSIQHTKNLDHSYKAVQPVLNSLCDGLLDTSFAPESWADQLFREVLAFTRRALQETDSKEEAIQSSLSGFASVPRLARRRVIRQILPTLPLPELTAILMQYVDKSSTSDMVGLVDETECAVCERLASAHQQLQQELQKQVSTS